MKPFNRRLAVMILKNTTAYKLNHISYKSNPNKITIWSSKSNYGIFYATDIIQLFTHLFDSYIQYNLEEKRCELIIF